MAIYSEPLLTLEYTTFLFPFFSPLFLWYICLIGRRVVFSLARRLVRGVWPVFAEGRSVPAGLLELQRDSLHDRRDQHSRFLQSGASFPRYVGDLLSVPRSRPSRTRLCCARSFLPFSSFTPKLALRRELYAVAGPIGGFPRPTPRFLRSGLGRSVITRRKTDVRLGRTPTQTPTVSLTRKGNRVYT